MTTDYDSLPLPRCKHYEKDPSLDVYNHMCYCEKTHIKCGNIVSLITCPFKYDIRARQLCKYYDDTITTTDQRIDTLEKRVESLAWIIDKMIHH